MINPQKIVRYDYTDAELEELAIFCICVAGKSAKTIAPRVHKLCYSPVYTPFEKITLAIHTGVYTPEWFRTLGIGCYTQKAQSVAQLVGARLDLRTCSVSDLEKIKGIGPKTARFIIMSSRRDVKHAALDTHILRRMRDRGIKTPKSTPVGKKYLDLEQQYLKMVPEGKTAAEFDLEIWNEYSKNK